MDLLKRRQEIIDRHRTLESVPGSGYHPDDPTAREAARRGEKPLSERIVALKDDEDICVVGPDAARLRQLLGTFCRKLKELQAESRAAGQDEPDVLNFGLPWQICVVRYTARVMATEGDVRVPTQQWNYLNSVLQAMRVDVVLAMAEEKAPVNAFRWAEG